MDTLRVIRRSPVVFVLAMLAALAILSISEGSYWQAAKSLNRLFAVTDARASILDLRRSILDAETGQRGYLLTSREDYLAPYERALGPISDLFRILDSHFHGNAEAIAIVGQMRETVKARLSMIAETVRLKQEGRSDLATELMLTGFDKEQMEEIQQLGTALLAQGTSSLEAGRENVHGTLQFGRIGVMAWTALSLLALFIHLRNAAAAEELQRQLTHTIQAERDQLEVVVARRTEVLTALAQHLQTAREDERQRLARNLHDDLGSLLTTAKLEAASIKSRLAGAAPEARERLAKLVETLNASIALGRSIIEDLRPSTLANLGLVSAIENLVGEYSELVGIEVHSSLSPVKLTASAELVVYRLVQEAITNIGKYANAKQIWVELSSSAGRVQVLVRDDGRGFDTTVNPGSAYGLVGMRFRVEAEGGVLTVVSAPGEGTRIQANLPEAT